jgi:RNA 2',3'-cyclic 3'-phosphodiesterase
MAAAVERPGLELSGTGVVRAFLAVLVPSAVATLEALRGDADLQALPVRWQAPEGLHLTLAFLGETPHRQLAAAWPAVASVAREHRPIPLTLLQPELFPPGRHPIVIAAAVQDARGALQAVHTQVTEALREAGYSLDERQYHPHVSLGRLRPPLLRGQAAAIAAALHARQWPGAGGFQAPAICLLRSDLFPDGARYTVLAEAALGAPR